MHTVFTMQGIGELLEVYADKIRITPTGIIGFFTKRITGIKTIPYLSISDVRLKTSGLTSGYLKMIVSIHGTFEELTFVFVGQNAVAGQIKDYIEKRTLALGSPKRVLEGVPLAKELKRLLELKRQGALSEDEFNRAKKRLFEK